MLSVTLKSDPNRTHTHTQTHRHRHRHRHRHTHRHTHTKSNFRLPLPLIQSQPPAPHTQTYKHPFYNIKPPQIFNFWGYIRLLCWYNYEMGPLLPSACKSCQRTLEYMRFSGIGTPSLHFLPLVNLFNILSNE